jgi:cell filamentation protein
MPDEDPYVYPGTRVLRNRYDVRDATQLARLEADITARRAAVLIHTPLPGAYDLQAFHRALFSDLYEWGGEIRTVAIAKGDLFALPQHIEPYLNEVLKHLPSENHLQGLPPDRTIDRLTHYLAELNSVHPFRDGNETGRFSRRLDFGDDPSSGTENLQECRDHGSIRWS